MNLLSVSILLEPILSNSLTHAQLEEACAALWTPEVSPSRSIPVCADRSFNLSLGMHRILYSNYSSELFIGQGASSVVDLTAGDEIDVSSTGGSVAVSSTGEAMTRTDFPPVMRFSPVFDPTSLAAGPSPNSPGIRHIYILILDSTSRISLSEFAPNLALYLNETGFTAFSLFTPVSPGGTRAALFPMLYGGISAACESAQSPDYARMMDFVEIARNCTDPGRRLFELAKESGRRTAFVEMTKSKQYVVNEGSIVDHMIPNLPYEGLFGTNQGVAPDNSCIGGKLGAVELLEYAEKVLMHADGEDGGGSFGITHLSGAHETPNHLRGLSDHVVRHLQQIAKLKDSLIVVMGDHGLVDIHCDYRRPFLAIKTSSLEMQLKLDAWRDQRVSPWDLYATLRWATTGQSHAFPERLPESIYAMPLSRYDKLITFNTSTMHPVNLLRESPPEARARTCVEAGVADVMCDEPSDQEGLMTHEAYLCGVPPSNLPKRLPLDLSRAFKVHRMGDPGLFSWCQQYMKVAEQCVNFVNSILPDYGPCRTVELAYLETGVLDHTTGLWELVVHVHSGREIDATFQFSVSDMDTRGILSMRLMAFKQLTRFRRHEKCTPKGLNPEMCLCDE